MNLTAMEATSNRGRYRWTGRILLVLLGVLIPVLSGEILLRLFLDGSVNTFAYDELTGFMRPRGGRGRYITEEFSTSVEFNSLGLNDREWGEKWNNSKACKILMLGDSMLESLQVPRSENFVERLNRQYSPDLQIMNAGVSSFGTVQEWLLGEKLLGQYHFDLVILFFLAANDVRNNLPDLEEPEVPAGRRVRPYLVEAADGWMLDSPAAENVSTVANPPLLYGILSHSRLYTFIKERVRRNAIPIPFVSKTVGEVASSDEEFPRELGVYIDNNAEPWRRGWRTTAEALRRLDLAAEQAGAELAIAAMPGPEQSDSHRWEKLLGLYPAFLQASPSPLLPVSRLASLAAETKSPFIDIVSMLEKAADPSGLHYAQDGHLTAVGHAAIAEGLGNLLVDLCGKNIPTGQFTTSGSVHGQF